MQRLGTRVFCKVGAECVHCTALPGADLGVAIEIENGNNARAAELVRAALIEARVRRADDERGFTQSLSDLPLRNLNVAKAGALRGALGRRGAAAAA